VILRPRELPAPGLIPLRVGLAAAVALDPFAAPAAPRVKWPNDLLLAGRKLAGILCEGSWEAGRPSFVVVGIGVNVGHSPGDFPEEIRGQATSLRIGSGWSPPRAEVASALVRAVCGLTAHTAANLVPGEMAEMEGRDALRGHPVVVTGEGVPPREGVALGVSPEGALLLRTPEGVLRSVHSGTVRLVPGAFHDPLRGATVRDSTGASRGRPAP
jgi:BirA family biotin operon repressor/biotin-[acetyl-CoA-carboxylase] ligase